MSCKVVSRGALPAFQPLVLPGAPGLTTPATVALPNQEEAAEASAPAEEVAELHGRVVELERALQRDVRQARESAFKEGEKAGRQHAAAELQPVLEKLTRSITEVASLRSKIRRETEIDLVKLAIAIARRVLRREVSVEPEAVQGLLKAALEKAQGRDICKVRLHPDHAAFVRKQLEQTGAAGSADVSADPSLQLGDLIIETGRGDLDASIETQLGEIERGFADRFRQGS